MSADIVKRVESGELPIVFDDDTCSVVLLAQAALGHVVIIPKSGAHSLSELPQQVVERIFFVANTVAVTLFEVLRAQGTNLIVDESDARVVMHVIARAQEDGMNFLWTPKPTDPESLQSVAKNITQQLVMQDQSQMVASMPIESQKPKETIRRKQDQVNYLIRHLERIP